MQITNINYGGEHSFDFDDLTYGGDYQDNQYVSGSLTEVTLISGDIVSLTLDETAKTITFTSIGSSDGAEIITQEGAKLEIANGDTSTQIFEGFNVYAPQSGTMILLQELIAAYDNLNGDKDAILWNE